MTESDRELLELAAKAVGGEYKNHALGGMYLAFPPNWNGVRWGPLTDDGDALRLAVKMQLEIYIDHGGVAVRTHCGLKTLEDGCDSAAARRAIVKAAAAIGRTLP